MDWCAHLGKHFYLRQGMILKHTVSSITNNAMVDSFTVKDYLDSGVWFKLLQISTLNKYMVRISASSHQMDYDI